MNVLVTVVPTTFITTRSGNVSAMGSKRATINGAFGASATGRSDAPTLSGHRLQHRQMTQHGLRCGVLKKPDCAPSFNLLVNKDTLVAFHVGPDSAARRHSIMPMTVTLVFGNKLGLFSGPRLFFGNSHFHVFKRFDCGGARRGFCNVNCDAGGSCIHDSAADRCQCDKLRVGP